MSLSEKYFFALAMAVLLLQGMAAVSIANGKSALPAPDQKARLSQLGQFGAELSASPPIQWNKTYDLEYSTQDYCYSLVQSIDGGFVMAGERDGDFCLAKTNMAGDMLWNKTYWHPTGHGNDDRARSVARRSDGGYIVAGTCWTFYDPSTFYDGWIVFTDANGDCTSQLTYSRTSTVDEFCSVIETSDGGWAAAGYAGGSYSDFWLVKVNASGTWGGTYGGSQTERAYSVIETMDGGYALAGYTNSYGAGSYDFWLVKADAYGNHLWNRTYGGLGDERSYSVVQTSDGGYALAGSTSSFGRDGTGDSWLVKTDANGDVQWNKTYGEGIRWMTSYNEATYSMVQTVDGGFALAGIVQPDTGDLWLVKTDSLGVMQWNMTYGFYYPQREDVGQSIVQTTDGGYAVAGYTSAQYGLNAFDFWLVKVGAEEHDVAVKSVTTCKDGCNPFPVVGQNCIMHINATVENQGHSAETFTVEVKANTTTINQTQLTLPSGATTTLTIEWNATLPHANYAISAVADTVSEETDTLDNTCVGITVLLTLPGDANGDKKVNILDAIQLAVAFNSKPEDPNWNPSVDINGDNKVNILDCIILAGQFNQSWS